MKDNPKLTRFIEAVLDVNDVVISSVKANMSGASMETYCLSVDFTEDGAPHSRELILRRKPISGITEPCDVIQEYKIMSALQNQGIVLPQVYGADPSGKILERPFYVMEKIEGAGALPPKAKFLAFPDPRERETLAQDFVANLVALHQFDWRKAGVADFLPVPGSGKDSALLQVAFWEGVIARAGNDKHPLVTLALNWLKANAPENDGVVVVHGDYRTGNYLHQNGRITAILDWEMAHLGDPHEDIAYVLHEVWTSPPPDRLLSHLLDTNSFFAAYQNRSGMTIDLAKVGYYQVLTELKAVAIASKAAHEFTRKPSPDLRPGYISTMIDTSYLGLIAKLSERMR